VIRAAFSILGFILLVSCAEPQEKISSSKDLESVETIMVMPFQALPDAEGSRFYIDCSFCNRRHTFEEVPQGASEFMTEHLKELLINVKAYRFVFPDQADGIPSNLRADKNGIVTMTDLLELSGNANGVDAVLLGYLFRFRERVGTRYSVESPASVSFSLFLVRTADGQVVWRGTFEETQQSLSENLLKIGSFIKRKARWVTAGEMAADALEDLMSTFTKP
jgi:hypothetical protein